MVRLGPSLAEWQENNLEHLRYEYDLKPDDIVIDLGSYRREFADEIKRRYGCYVECFDALDNRAAWTENGTIQMGGAYYYTSAFEKESPQHTFKCVDIKPYLGREIALMKVNIEGMEYPLLKHILDADLMRNIKNLQVQFHLIDGIECETIYAEIAADLQRSHFLTWRTPFVWENWRRNEK